jgi:hypothetical protein
VLDRNREHRLFRRLPPARIDQLLGEAANGGSADDVDVEAPVDGEGAT